MRLLPKVVLFPSYTLTVTLSQRLSGPHWAFRGLLVLAGLGTPFLTLNLSHWLIDPSLDYFGFGLATWFFLVACSAVFLTALTLVCYRFLTVFKGASSRSLGISVVVALVAPIASTWLAMYIPAVIHRIELKRDYTTAPGWIKDRQSALETVWRTNPSSQPWRDLFPQIEEVSSIRHTIDPKVPTLSVFDRSADTSVSYYKKSEMLGLSEVDGHVYLEVAAPINLDVSVTFFREGEARVNGIYSSTFLKNAGDTYFKVLSCERLDKIQQITLQLTPRLPDIREQQLAISGDLGYETFDERDVRLTGRRLVITTPSLTYDQAKGTEGFSGAAAIRFSREHPVPRVSLFFDFGDALVACLQNS